MASGGYGFLFSVSGIGGEAETVGHVDGGFAEPQTGVAGPWVEDVALGLTLRMEAAEDASAQVDREGTMPLVRIVV